MQGRGCRGEGAGARTQAKQTGAARAVPVLVRRGAVLVRGGAALVRGYGDARLRCARIVCVHPAHAEGIISHSRRPVSGAPARERAWAVIQARVRR